MCFHGNYRETEKKFPYTIEDQIFLLQQCCCIETIIDVDYYFFKIPWTHFLKTTESSYLIK